MPYGNISVLHLRNVKANIVTVCCFFPFALYYAVLGNGKKRPRRVADTSVLYVGL